MNPLVSICTPSYNHQKFVQESIDSVLDQTYTNFELIIVDDVSTDNAPEIIKSYNDPRIRFYQNENNIKCYQTVNKAASLAKGDFIAILHTDDKYDPNFLEEVVQAYQKYPDQKVFVTGISNLDHVLGHITPSFPFSKEGIIPKKEVLIRLAYENNIGNGINVVIHKDAINQVGFWNPGLEHVADYDLYMRLAHQYDFVFIPKLLTYYRMHDSNVTNRVFFDMIKQGHEVCNKHLNNSSVISESLHEKLFTIQSRSMLNKALYIGFKYNSKSLSQNLLNFFRDTYPKLKHDPYWYLIYSSSFLINNLSSKFITEPLFKLGRFYRASVTENINKLTLYNSQ